MKKNILIILVFALNISLNAQTSNVDELVIRRVADYILAHGKLNLKMLVMVKFIIQQRIYPRMQKLLFQIRMLNGTTQMAF